MVLAICSLVDRHKRPPIALCSVVAVVLRARVGDPCRTYTTDPPRQVLGAFDKALWHSWMDLGVSFKA